MKITETEVDIKETNSFRELDCALSVIFLQLIYDRGIYFVQ